MGVATGIQEKFSWKAVALAAIGGGVAGGGTLGVGGRGLLSTIGRSMVANVVSQGVDVVTGLQDRFDWAAVAAAGVGAGVGFKVGNSAVLAGASSNVVKGVVSGATAIANAATRTLIDGSDFGDNIAASLPSVLGTMVVDGLTSMAWGGSGADNGVVYGDDGSDLLAGGDRSDFLPTGGIPAAARQTEVVIVTASRSRRNPFEAAAARVYEDTQAAIQRGIAIGNTVLRSPPPMAIPVGRPMTPRENYIINAQQHRIISNQSARYAGTALAEGLPVISDGLAIRAAIRDPSAANIINAGVGLVPLGGDVVAAGLRANSTSVKTGLNAAEGAVPLTKAEQLALNAVNGRAFEQAGIKGILSHVGLGKNTTAITRNGVTTILDASGRPAGLVEFKDVANLSSSPQLRAQLAEALATRQPYNLVVSPGNQSISKPLLDQIRAVNRQLGGGVYRYDPATDILTPFRK